MGTARPQTHPAERCADTSLHSPGENEKSAIWRAKNLLPLWGTGGGSLRYYRGGNLVRARGSIYDTREI